MKKLICFLVIFGIGFAIHAFDSSLNGSWGLIKDGEKMVIIQFNTDEIIITNTLFRAGNYTETDDSIYIDDFEGDSVVLQYYRLSANKLLIVIWNTDNPEQSITLILSKL